MCAPTAFAPAARWMGAVPNPLERMLLLADLRARKFSETARDMTAARAPGDIAAAQTRYMLEMMNDYRAFWTPVAQTVVSDVEVDDASPQEETTEPPASPNVDQATEADETAGNDAEPLSMAS